MDYLSLNRFLDRQNYFVNIGLKASDNCIKDYESTDLTDDELSCLKKSSLDLHHIVNNSKLERWALETEKRPFAEYYWKLSKLPQN